MPATHAHAFKQPSSERAASSSAGVRPGEGTACPVEEIARSYLATAEGDAGIVLRCAITDALADLLEAERRARENSRLISRGYVRAAMIRG